MALFTNFKIGARTYKDAHKFIVRHKLWHYVILPAFINVGIILFLIFTGWHYFGLLTDWFFDLIGLSGESEGFIGTIFNVIKAIFRIILQILLFLFYWSIYRYIILIILSPFLALLSEKTEEIISGRKYPFHFGHFLKDVFRGIRIVIRNSFMEILLTICFFLLSYIPVIGYISTFAVFFTTCYFYGFSMIDYTNERHRLTVRQSVKYVRKNMGFAFANGMIFYFILFFIPFFGFMIAPAYAVVAATLGVHEINMQPPKQKKGKRAHTEI